MAPSRKKLKIEHIPSDEDNEDSSDASTHSSIALSDHVDPTEASTSEQESGTEGNASDEEEEEREDSEDDPHDADTPHRANDVNGASRQSLRATLTVNNGQERPSSTQKGRQATANSGPSTSQLERMLQLIRPKHTSREVDAEAVLHALRKTIETVPALGPFNISDARKVLREQSISIPFPHPQPAEDSNLKFSYARPATMNVAGSYPIKTANRSRRFLYIDMVVQMPDDLFQDKDYTNYRYFYKRAFYMACLASAISAAHGKSLDIRYQDHHDDSLRPVITIRSSQAEPSRQWQITILPSISSSLFPAAKLVPGKISIRQAAESSELQNIAYNSSLRADMLVSPYLKLLHQASVSCQAYRDSCVLGSAWLKLRGFRATPGQGGFASFEWAALVALLLQAGEADAKPLLAKHLDSLQIFKTVLQVVCNRDLVKRPLVVGTGTSLSTPTSSSGPIVWDAARGHNLLFKMPVWSFRRLQVEAKTTLAMLGDPDYDGFEPTFSLKKNSSLLNFDFFLKLDAAKLHAARASSSDADIYGEVYRTLKQGLGNRASQITIHVERSKAWSVRTGRGASNRQVKIGIVVNPKNVNRAVDHGPPAEDKVAAAAFREFWGEKAELRRFKDGSILEALVWDTTAGSAPVLEQTVRYLLRTHFGEAVASDALLVSDAYGRMSASDESASDQSFKRLETDIRGLQDIPLSIRQIVVAGHTGNVGEPKPARPARVQIVDVVLQFESSGRWPDDLPAIQRTKLAFLLKIGELLEQSVNDIQAMVGVENETYDIMNQGFLDILYPGTAAFRLRIYHDREQTLLERMLKDKAAHPRSIELAAQALATYKREFLKRPAHAQAMIQLSSRYPTLKRTVGLFQKWIASHLLHNHISAELVELLAITVFTQPWPWQAPTSVQTGFFRIIVWLARWDWRREPAIVDNSTDHKMTGVERRTIRTRYDAWRKLDPAMNKVAMFVASTTDPDGTTYSTERPSKVVAGRLTALARAASAEIYLQDMQLSPQSLFVSPLADFDFVIHLDPQYSAGSKRKRQGSHSFKNIELHGAADVVAVDSNPAQDFLDEIESLYSSAVLFLSGLPYRNVIGGLWTPQTEERPWKMNLAYSTLPVQSATQSEAHARLNTVAILAEIARLGGELVEHIELPKAGSSKS